MVVILLSCIEGELCTSRFFVAKHAEQFYSAYVAFLTWNLNHAYIQIYQVVNTRQPSEVQ